jgi:hypothetical protein
VTGDGRGRDAVDDQGVADRPAKRSIIGVSMYPGHTALIRTFFAAYSSAAARVSPMTPCFAAV